ncbi:MAG: 23S rRNA (guanosine(2251)-2'-O)-methyltransferase RlmB [Acidobacteria bacterium]|nr:23S rRNA (guanosine(2251)-2'-O)-methyltransferase RlmB [Acidobacteriota bacterium]
MKDFKGRGKKQKPKFEAGGRDRERPPKKFDRRSEDSRLKTQDSRLKTEDSRLIYGLLPVLEALRANARRIEKILIAEGAREHRIAEIFELARAHHIPFQKVTREALARLVEPGANHQGVVAHAAAADYRDPDELLEEIFAAENPLVLVLDGVEDPRNLGAILRVAECAGVAGTFIPEHRAASLTETVVKTSAGATEYTPLAKVKNLNRLIEELKKNNIWVVGTSGAADLDYADWDWTRKCALVLGGEGRGLHRLVAENCDALVKIPMRGRIESLNVSVAAGVILFEAGRQRDALEKERRGEREKGKKGDGEV